MGERERESKIFSLMTSLKWGREMEYNLPVDAYERFNIIADIQFINLKAHNNIGSSHLFIRVSFWVC